MSSIKPRRLLPLAILLLALALRLVAIDHIPPGLSHDEAYNGVTAIEVLNGQRLIFFEINKGIEPLIIYLEALAFAAFGISPVAMRLVNVICGMLTVALVYPLATRLFNRRVALLAMAGLAISFWAIFTSRLALRAVTLPPLLLLTLYCFWRGLASSQKSRARDNGIRSVIPYGIRSVIPYPLSPTATAREGESLSSILFLTGSGIATGAIMYTYLSSRFVPLLLMAIWGYQLLRGQAKKWHWLGIVLLLVIWAIIFAPLANYFLNHAASFTERSNQVSTLPYALNGDFGPLIRHTWRTLGMFTFYGDETDRYNLDGRPVFDWVNGLLFYLGLTLAVLRLRRSPEQAGPAALLLGWLFFMLLPGFITDDSPHFLRTIGAMPAVYIFWAIGLEAVIQRIAYMANNRALRFVLHPLVPGWGSSLILLLLLLTTLHTTYDYFIRWANAPEARAIYGADVTEAARYLQTNHDKSLAAISAEYYRDLDPFRLMLHFHGQPPFVLWFDGRQSLAFPPPASGLSPRYLFLASAPPPDVWQPFLQPVPDESGRDYTLYRLPKAVTLQQAQVDSFPSENRLGVKVNQDLVISAYQVLGTVVSGGKFQVLLSWQALRVLPPGTDYTFLVRLKDSQNYVWAEADGNGYNPDNWQPGVQGLQLLTLRLPGDLPPQTYHFTLEVVDRQRGQALPTDKGESSITLGKLPGQLAPTPRPIDPEKLPNPLPLDPTHQPEEELALRGYEIKNPTLSPGEALSLTLHWQVLQPPRHNYQLQFYLTSLNNTASPQLVFRWPAQAPVNGQWPTGQWPANYWVQDRLSLPIGPEMTRGRFKLHLALVTKDNAQSPNILSGPKAANFELDTIVIAE